MMKYLLPGAVALFGMCGLAACTPSQVAGVNTTLSQAEVDATTTVQSYEAVLGIAEVAEMANPALEAKLQAIEAKAAPFVAQLQPLETDATADATTIEALVAQLAAQEASLMATAAPAVKVQAGS